MMARRFEGGFLFGRAVPLGLRRPRCDELFGQPILTRPPVRATQPWGLLQPDAGSIRGIGVSIRLQSGTSHKATETFST
jgi:hypothetical protein